MKTPDSHTTDSPAPSTDGRTTDAKEILNFSQLISLTMSERFYEFTVNDQRHKLKIRGLTAEESNDLDKIDGAIVPPKLPSTIQGGLPNYNEDDPVYKEKLQQARRRKRAAALNMGLLSFKVDGANLEEQTSNLYKQLPIGVIEDIYQAIIKLTTEPFEGALFTSTAS